MHPSRSGVSHIVVCVSPVFSSKCIENTPIGSVGGDELSKSPGTPFAKSGNLLFGTLASDATVDA